MKKYLLLLASIVLFLSNSFANTNTMKSVGSFYPNALMFDGVDDYVSIDNSLTLNSGGAYANRTIETWFYLEDVNNSSKKQVIFEEGDATRGFNMYVFNGSLYVGGWNTQSTESNWSGTWLSTNSISSNTWHHVALRLEGGTNTPVAESFSGILDGIVFAQGEGAKVYAHPGEINIGRSSSTKFHDGLDNTANNYFKGTMDEVRIWNEARSTEEIRANMYRQLSLAVISASSYLVAYFTMDQAEGDRLLDFSNNQNQGTLRNMSNSNWIKSTVLYDLRQSLDFDGIDDYVSISNNSQLQIGNSITLEAWVNPRSKNQSGAIFSNLQNNASQESGYGLILNGDTEKLVWWLQTVGGSSNDDANYPGFTPALDTWQHIACTYDGTEMKLFVDGVLLDSKARTGSIDWTYLPTEARIGSYVKDNEASYFDGQIDDVRIWNKALTAGQIAESMNNPLFGTEDNLVAYYRFDQLNDLTQGVLYNIAGDYVPNNYTENFDSYALNTNVSTIPGWYTWNGGTATDEDAIIVNTEASSVQNSMRITGKNDIIYTNGNLTTGIHSVKFRMYVPAGKHGYFNLEHLDIPGIEWSLDAFFDGSGNAHLTTEGIANSVKFNYSNNQWFTMEVIVDLEKDLASMYMNGNFIHSWKWSMDSFGKSGAVQLGCVDFYAFDPAGPESPLFYIDDFSVTKLDANAINGVLVNMEPTLDWSSALSIKVWTGATDTDWTNSSNWLTAKAPSASDVVRIERTETGNYPIVTSNQAAGKLSIAEGASFEIILNKRFNIGSSLVNNGTLNLVGTMSLNGMLMNYKEINLSGALTVEGQLVNNGNFNILSSADYSGSLIDKGDISGYGEFAVQHYLSSDEKWHLISSPVSNAYSSVFSDRSLLSYNESSDVWNTIFTTDVSLGAMKGYAAMTDATSTTNNTYLYKGAVNTGDFTSTLSHDGTNQESQNFNLLGNPYASGIDWDLVTIPADMDDAVYFLKADGQYASYVNGISINGGTRNIAPGQGFWVRAKSGISNATEVNFTLQNKDRVHELNEQHLEKAEGPVNDFQFSLFATYGDVTDETILIFDNAALPQFDSEYDAVKFTAYEQQIPNIYFIGANDERLAIDSRPETSEVPVGFMMKQGAEHVKISIKNAGNFTAVVLEDLFTGEKIDLLQESYSFDYTATDNANRFKLHFEFMGADDDLIPADNGLQIYSNQSDVIINSIDGLESPIMQVYDIQGRMVFNTDLGYTTFKRVPLNLNAGTYVVKLIHEEGVVSEKVFLQ